MNNEKIQQSSSEADLNKEKVLETNENKGFDLDKLRLSQDFHEVVGVKKALITVPVRKPSRQDFIRVLPGEDWKLETAIVELEVDRETYLIDPSLWSELPGEIIPKVLFTTINRQGVLTLWPIRLPGEDGRLDSWNQSALEAAEMAEKRWIRLASNKSLRAYEVYEATGDIPKPVWPDITFDKIIKIAFKNRYIDSRDHPVVHQLRGEF
jgi:hypothetical protein